MHNYDNVDIPLYCEVWLVWGNGLFVELFLILSVLNDVDGGLSVTVETVVC